MTIKLENRFPYLIIAVLLVIIFLQRQCSGKLDKVCPTTTKTVTVTKTELKYDTVVKTIKVPLPTPVCTIKVVTHLPIDTAAVVADYFTKVAYSQTIEDTNLRAYITDTLFNNRIVARNFSYQLLKPEKITTITNTITVTEKPRAKVFAGFGVGASTQGFAHFGPQITYLSKKDNMYHISANAINPSIILGMGWKIKLRK
jgi:hypothetical protein